MKNLAVTDKNISLDKKFNNDKDLITFLKMINKPIEKNFLDITKELVELKKDNVLSHQVFNNTLKRLCLVYLESLVDKYISENFDQIIINNFDDIFFDWEFKN